MESARRRNQTNRTRHEACTGASPDRRRRRRSFQIGQGFARTTHEPVLIPVIDSTECPGVRVPKGQAYCAGSSTGRAGQGDSPEHADAGPTSARAQNQRDDLRVGQSPA